MPTQRRKLAFVSALGALLVGCSFESKGVDDLVNQYATYINFPGKRWLSGSYSDYVFDGTRISGSESRPSEEIVGLRNGSELVIAREDASACSAGSATRFLPFWRYDYRLHVERPAVVSFLTEEDDTGRGKLSFASVDCDVWSTGLEHAELPIFIAYDTYLVRDLRDGDDALFVVDPWQRTLSEVAPSVSQAAQRYDGTLFTLEAGQLVRRDLDLNPVTLASDVRAFLDMGNDSIAYETSSSVSVRSSQHPDWDLQGITPCAFRPPKAQYGFGVSFLMRCPPTAGDSLVTYGAYENRGYFVSLPDVSEDTYVSYSTTRTESTLLALTPTATLADGREVGTLWGGELTSGAVVDMTKLGDSTPLPNRAMGYPAYEPGGITRFLRGIEDGLGTLVDWQTSDGSFREVASRIRDFDGTLAISLSEDGKSQLSAAYLADPVPLLEGVSNLSATTWIRGTMAMGLLVIVDEQDGAGRLLFAQGATEAWLTNPGQIHFDVIDEHVAPSTIGFLDFGAVGYLRDVDAVSGAGSLRIHFIDSKDTFERKGVRYWSQSAVADGPGVLYDVPDGPDAGVWFARAK